MNKTYTVRLQFTNQRISETVYAPSAREALTHALERVRGRFPTIQDPSAVSVSVQWRELERAVAAEAPIIDAEFPEAGEDAAPPKTAQNDAAVAALMERYHALQSELVLEESKVQNAQRRIEITRKGLSQVGEALAALGADPTHEDNREEF